MATRYPTYSEDDWVKPVPRIRGVGLANGQPVEYRPFRPYVYRGTGLDQFPETVTDEEIERKERNREVARMKRVAKANRERELQAHYLDMERARRAVAREAERIARQIRHSKVVTVQTILDPPPEPRQIKAAAGFAPLTGADIDDLLGE